MLGFWAFLVCIAFHQCLTTPAYAMTTDDAYAELGLAAGATEHEIKAAWRRLVSQWHPDRNHSPQAVARMQRINEAFETLRPDRPYTPDPRYSADAERKAREADEARKSAAERKAREEKERAEALAKMEPYWAGIEKLYQAGAPSVAGSAEELDLLLRLFGIRDDGLFGNVISNKRIKTHQKEIFASPHWKNTDNGLFRTFVDGWGLYKYRQNYRLVGQLFAQLDPQDPELYRVIREFKANSSGDDFRKSDERRGWIRAAIPQMLKAEKYRGTPAGLELMDHIVDHWKTVEETTFSNRTKADLLASSLMELLDVPEWRENPKLLTMLRSIPQLLRENSIGHAGFFWEQEDRDKYRDTFERHSDLFQELEWRTPADDLYFLYVKYSPEELEQAAETEEELRVLWRVFGQGKYEFEALMRDRYFGEAAKVFFTRPIWTDTQNGLFRRFVQHWGFYNFKYSPDTVGKLFAMLNPNDSFLQQVIYRFDFSTPGHDFRTRELRMSYIKPILSVMLSQEQYLGTADGERLLNHVYSLWQDFKRSRVRNSYADVKWALSLIRLLDEPSLRMDRRLLSMIRDIPTLVNQRDLAFTLTEDKRVLKEYLERYPDIFTEQPAARAASGFGSRNAGPENAGPQGANPFANPFAESILKAYQQQCEFFWGMWGIGKK